MVDIVGFGARDAEERSDVQDRLDELVARVVGDLGTALEDTESAVAGDSTVVFLPGYLDRGDFTQVTAKEFAAPAWLRVC